MRWNEQEQVFFSWLPLSGALSEGDNSDDALCSVGLPTIERLENVNDCLFFSYGTTIDTLLHIIPMVLINIVSLCVYRVTNLSFARMFEVLILNGAQVRRAVLFRRCLYAAGIYTSTFKGSCYQNWILCFVSISSLKLFQKL